MVRGENVYTGRFPFKFFFTSMIAFSHFSLNVVLWFTTGSKKIVSVSDISGVNFIASRAVRRSKFTCSVNLKKSTMSGLLISHKEKISSM